MRRRDVLSLGASMLTVPLLASAEGVMNQHATGRLYRIAELQIDPAQLDRYKAALAEEIDSSLRAEPGVLKLDAVSLRDDPGQIRIYEVYASEDAYHAHLESSHFKKYKSATEGMVKSLKLYEADPIRVGIANRE
jgi:quinol monooxygenase YgiN